MVAGWCKDYLINLMFFFAKNFEYACSKNFSFIPTKNSGYAMKSAVWFEVIYSC